MRPVTLDLGNLAWKRREGRILALPLLYGMCCGSFLTCVLLQIDRGTLTCRQLLQSGIRQKRQELQQMLQR